MDAMFTNSNNSITCDLRRLILNFTNEISLLRSDKYVALSNLSIYYTWKNTKRLYKDNKFKISAPTWNDKFELPNRSCSVSYIEDYFGYIIKKHETLTDNLPIKICANKI